MMEDEQTAQSQSNGIIAIAESVVVVNRNESNANNATTNGGSGNMDGRNVPPRGPKTAPPVHNNEDTSISSSVMTDSGDDGEDVVNNLDFEGETKESKQRSKNLSCKKYITMESEKSQDGSYPVKEEKERLVIFVRDRNRTLFASSLLFTSTLVVFSFPLPFEQLLSLLELLVNQPEPPITFSLRFY